MAKSWLDEMMDATRTASPNTKTALFGGWAADNKGCCSGSKLGIFDWRALKAAGVYSNPGWYCGQKNLRLLATQVAREKAALGPGWQMIPTLTTMGATAFAGGRLRSEEMFDVMAQSFANGGTGIAIFEDPYTDDPGVYLAMAEAISIAAKYVQQRSSLDFLKSQKKLALQARGHHFQRHGLLRGHGPLRQRRGLRDPEGRAALHRDLSGRDRRQRGHRQPAQLHRGRQLRSRRGRDPERLARRKQAAV